MEFNVKIVSVVYKCEVNWIGDEFNYVLECSVFLYVRNKCLVIIF